MRELGVTGACPRRVFTHPPPALPRKWLPAPNPLAECAVGGQCVTTGGHAYQLAKGGNGANVRGGGERREGVEGARTSQRMRVTPVREFVEPAEQFPGPLSPWKGRCERNGHDATADEQSGDASVLWGMGRGRAVKWWRPFLPPAGGRSRKAAGSASGGTNAAAWHRKPEIQASHSDCASKASL